MLGSEQWMYSAAAGFYDHEVGGSLCFDDGSSSRLSRTPSSAGDQKTFTFSCWVKRADIPSGESYLFSAGTSSTNFGGFEFIGGELAFQNYNSGTQVICRTGSSILFRDNSAWYHIVFTVDTTEATLAERVKLYVNGKRVTLSTDADLTQNYDTQFNATNQHNIGARQLASPDSYFDGYLAEVHFLNGIAATADDFGEFKSGVWIPKAYTGNHDSAAQITAGTETGFHLDMVSSNFSSPTLSDSSGNDNDFTVSGIGINDFVLDSCTNNYAVMNYWWPYNSANQNVTYSEGNRKYAMGSSNSRGAATMEVLADGCYFEMLCKSNKAAIGVQSIDGQTIYAWNAVNSGELSNIGGTDPAGFSDGDIVSVAVGTDGNIKLYKNGTLQGTDNTLTGYTAGDPLLPMLGEFDTAGSNTIVANFGQDSTFAGNKTRQGNTDENGQGDFYYEPPSGFVALCTANMPDPAVDPNEDEESRDYFEAFVYTGNGAGLQVGDVIKKPVDTITIDQSLLFNDDDSANFSRTPSSAGSQKKFTLSVWVKRGNHKDLGIIHAATTQGSGINMNSEGQVFVYSSDGTNVLRHYSDLRIGDSVFWHHIFVHIDTSQAVGSQVDMYIDGIQTDNTANNSSAVDQLLGFNTAINHRIGVRMDNGSLLSSTYFDGYMAEFYWIDGDTGSTVDQDDFGQFDANGFWIPKTPTIANFGTNGFYLDFADTANFGDDESGNTNDWTANNFASTDKVTDVPTNNHMIMSSDNADGSPVLSDGNLRVSLGDNDEALGSFKIRAYGAGKFYWEVDYVSSASSNYKVGIGIANQGGTAEELNYGHQSPTYNTTNLIGVALDTDNQTIQWYKDGVSMGAATSYASKGWDFVRPIITSANSAGEEVVVVNFGQKSFSQTAPTGFEKLNEDNITVDDQNLESPDFVWIKRRNGTSKHVLVDSVRGARNTLFTDDTSVAEQTGDNHVVSFNKNGITLGSGGTGSGSSNTAGDTYVGWFWKGGGSSVSDTSGDINVNRSTSTTAGFSVITYSGSGTAGDTIAHGLGEIPPFFIVKRRNGTGWSWYVYHRDGKGNGGSLYLNSTGAGDTDSTHWNNTTPTSSFITLGSSNGVNQSTGNYVCYAFAEKEGFSRFGKYSDSYYSDYNADAPFVYLGFKTAFILIKSTSAGRPWVIYDNKRSSVNPAILWLQPNTTHADQSDATNHDIDFMANGFKVKGGSGDVNTTNEDYIFAAFAEMPFKYATAR